MSDEVVLPWPTVFTTVDIAAYDPREGVVLMGMKPGETQWRFPGGFADPSGGSFEADAARELGEETGLQLDSTCFHYINNFNIDDARYRDTEHQVRTMFFMVYALQEWNVAAADDLEVVKYVPLLDLLEYRDFVHTSHLVLLDALSTYLGHMRPRTLN